MLGLDPGERRIGVALSDPTGIIAQPHDVIDRKVTDPVKAVQDLNGGLAEAGDTLRYTITVTETAGALPRDRLSWIVRLGEPVAAIENGSLS